MPPRIHTLDLKFQGIPNIVAAFLIPHSGGALLIETGPGSTIGRLRAALEQFSVAPTDVTDAFLTHIHLDHAGAAGWLARQGARIHVHPKGAPHLANPEKLLKSATRIYGDSMERLWGECLPVPAASLVVLSDGEEINIRGLRIRAIYTPGHADHHLAFQFAGACFVGDVGGVRLPGPPHLRVPMPPPEFNLEKWRASVTRLQQEKCNCIALTHFGLFDDPETHFSMLERALDEVEEFIEQVMPGEPPLEEVNERFLEWTVKRSEANGVDPARMDAYEAANPSWMSTMGMRRYWHKVWTEGPLVETKTALPGDEKVQRS